MSFSRKITLLFTESPFIFKIVASVSSVEILVFKRLSEGSSNVEKVSIKLVFWARLLYVSIGGYFAISSNNALQSIAGLNSLTSIGGNLNFQSNNNLTTLSGFNNLASIGGSLYVNNNNNLTTLSGFNNLASIEGVGGGGLYIFNNNNLTTLSGFNNLANLRYSLSLHNNIKLCFTH